MLSRRSVMALLGVLALSAKAAESAIAAPDVCSAADVDKGFCLTCKTKAECVTDGAPPDPLGNCTVPGEACTVLAGVSTCRPVSETGCSCDKVSQCDAYNPDFTFVCIGEGPTTISTNCSASGETCVDGDCGTAASTISPEQVCVGSSSGLAVIPPLCTDFVYCANGNPVAVDKCDSGSYFDVEEKDCLAVPPVPCAGCADGLCPDKSDCSKYYICVGGAVLDEEICDPLTPDFDIIDSKCVPEGICTANDNCTYDLTIITGTTATTVSSSTATTDSSSTATTASSSTATTASSSTVTTASNSTATTAPSSTTTTAPSSTTTTASSSTATTSRPATCTADNVGQRYPHEDCKMYWTCYEISNGNYAYVESTCLGDYVFNPDTGYCDQPANVPGCLPTS